METFKRKLRQQLIQKITTDGGIPSQSIAKEVDHFLFKLCIDDRYFQLIPVADIAKHLQTLYAGKILYKLSGKSQDFMLNQKGDNWAIFCRRSTPTSVTDTCTQLEHMIEEEYLAEALPSTRKAPRTFDELTALHSRAYRIAVFRTEGSIIEDEAVPLRFYFCHAPSFVNPNPSPMCTELQTVSDVNYFAKATQMARDCAQTLLKKAINQLGPEIIVSKCKDENELRITIMYRRGTTSSIFSSFTKLYHSKNLYCTKKYVEQFSNGMSTIAAHLRPLPIGKNIAAVELRRRVQSVVDDLTYVFCLPRSPLTFLFASGMLSADEVSYAYCAWKFAFQFTKKYSAGYEQIKTLVEKEHPTALSSLVELQANLKDDVFTETRVFEAVHRHLGLMKTLYLHFARHHDPRQGQKPDPKLLDTSEMETLLVKKLHSTVDLSIFQAILNFNKHIVKTNFFKHGKLAFSFRLDPGFLNMVEYPDKPHGIFYIVGSEFRGFHCRFSDVARGGIRIIRSANQEAYNHNSATLFDENYGLANTQNKKNKDIPEGGSKGTIFLNINEQDRHLAAFRKYVDAILDLLLPNDEIVDHYGKEEILFLGPDEGTADFMDWAARHARFRGAHFWKAFTTGKSRSMGGIPHDFYGMTTRSVYANSSGILKKLGLKENQVTKFQTGGPDGDLGSNEILLTTHPTLAVVDGSGVVFDPQGLDREELNRLARNRQMIVKFNRSKISSKGFFLSTVDRHLKLPNGELVENGLFFRNSFHLNPLISADLFVPCGGRPASINAGNVHHMFNKQGKPRFKYIVEGANLFITQDARLRLEDGGVILIKDASANKGGVTSSSSEVLAALALTDAEHQQHMCVRGDKPPPFYAKYVESVQKIIANNATLEFECIWRDSKLTGLPKCVLTDRLSCKINRLNMALQNSSLSKNAALKKRVIEDCVPSCLLQMVGIDEFTRRVPDSYLLAIFGAHLASRYVYSCGLTADEFSFFDFIEQYMKRRPKL